MRTLIDQIQTETAAKEQIAQVYPPHLVEHQLGVLIERKRKTALKTAEAVLIILKEMENDSRRDQGETS